MTLELIMIATMSSIITGGVLCVVGQLIKQESVAGKGSSPRSHGKRRR